MNDSLIEDLNQAVVQVDGSLRIVFCNRMFREIFGPGMDARDETLLTEIIPDRGLERSTCRVAESGSPLIDTEFVWPREGHEQRTFLLSISLHSTVPKSLVVTFFDVTEWKRRQHQVMEATHLVALGEMISGIAHEISNPLSAIIGLSQLALTQELESMVRQDLETTLVQARRASDIVAKLQAFSGGCPPSMDVIDLELVLRDILKAKKDSFRDNRVAVVTRFDPSIAAVKGDVGQLTQAFKNVINNAQQALAERDTDRVLSIAVTPVDDHVQLSFMDNGPGIEPQDLVRVFEPFFSNRGVGKGAGLGLSICHRIIHDHGGETRIESVPGSGANVIIKLPTSKRPGAGIAPVKSVEKDYPARKMSLLVVENEPVLTSILTCALSDQQHTVDTVTHATDVVNRTDLDSYDVIVIDIKSSENRSEAIFDYVRNLPGDISSKVLFVTCDIASASTQKIIKRTGRPVLAKPFTLAELNKTIRCFRNEQVMADGVKDSY